MFKPTKAKTITLMFLFLTIFMPTNLVFAESGDFSNTDYVLAANTEFEVTVNASDLNSVDQISFSLQYDPSLVTYVGLSEGALVSPTFFPTEGIVVENGDFNQVLVDVFPFDIVSGSGEVATLTFRTNQNGGTSQISMLNMTVFPSSGSPAFIEGATGADINVHIPEVSFVAPEITTDSGADFGVVLNAENLYNSNTISVYLEYDPSLVSFQGIDDGIFTDPLDLGIFYMTNQANGLETLTAFIPTDLVQEGSGELATVNFSTQNVSASTEISMTGLKVTQNDFSEISAIADSPLVVNITDKQNPTINITDPSNSSFDYTNSSNILTVSGTASDNTELASVTYSVDTGDSGSASGLENWSAAINLLAGNNVITMTATDSSGNKNTDQLTVVYTAPDTSKPVIEITSHSDPYNFENSNNILNVSGTASDDTELTSITYSVDTGDSGTATGLENWTADINLVEGNNFLTVTATDSSGNTSTDQLTVVYTVPDTTNPVVEITSHASPYNYENSNNILSVSGTASDNKELASITYSVDTGDSGTANGLENWSAAISLVEGSNVVTVTATDSSGNSSKDSITLNYSLPATPSISFAQTSYTDVDINTEIALSINIADLVNVDQVSFELDYDPSVISYLGVVEGTLMSPPLFPAIDATTELDGKERLMVDIFPLFITSGSGDLATVKFRTNTSGGETQVLMNSLTVFSADSGSIQGDTGASANINVLYPDLTKPVVNITSHSNPYSYENSNNILNVSGTASDDTELSSLTYSVDTGDSGVVTGLENWSTDISLVEGANIVTVTATDSSGNTSTDLLTVVYSTPDTTNPVVEITSHTSPYSYENVSNVLNISGTASDDTGLASVTYSVNTGDSGTASGLENWSADIKLVEGSNMVTVRATDSSGNTSTDQLTVVYTAPDTTNPVVEITSHTSPYTYVSESNLFSIYGTASDNDSVLEVSYSSDTGDSGIASGTNSWVAYINLVEGRNLLTISAVDANGNTGNSELVVTYSLPQVDTDTPIITGSSPSGSLSHATKQVTVSIETDEVAECHYSDVANTPFASSSPFSTTNSTHHEYTKTDLSEGQSYKIYVRCSDVNGNVNAQDYTVSFSIRTKPSSGGGGGGGSSKPNNPKEETVSEVKNFKYNIEGSTGLIEWTNPRDSAFSKVRLYKSMENLSTDTSLTDLAIFADMVYEGTEEQYLDNNVESLNVNYYITSIDVDGNNSSLLKAILSNSVKVPEQNITPALSTVEQAPISNTDQILLEASSIMEIDSRVALSQEGVAVYEKVFSGKSLENEYSRMRVAQFIENGTETTKYLGSGERGGVLNSYYSAYGRFPETLAEWSDLLKIANGRWPGSLNEDREEQTKKTFFRQIYKRDADMSNPFDNAAITIISYGLRPSERNLGSEANGITFFRNIFGYDPVSATDWDIVRAISYSGATR